MMSRWRVATLTLSLLLTLGCGSENDSKGGDGSSGDSSTGNVSGSGGSAASGDTGSDNSGDSGTATDSGASSDSGASTDSGGSGGTGATADDGSSSSSGGTGGEATTGSEGGAGGSGVEPYANVVAVSTSGSDGSYTFNVSIESSDVGCTQYTDWWEVLSEEGDLIYRRILTHSHTNENGTTDDTSTPDNTFTRSGGPVAIASDETVIVRAHNNVVGYSGMVMQGSVDGGFVDAPDIGSDFAADVEDDEPQVTDCMF